MKLSLLITALLVVGLGWFGWQGQTRLAAAKAVHASLAAEVNELGIGTDASTATGKLARASKSQREDQAQRENQARTFAGKLIAFAVEMERLEKAGKGRDDGTGKRVAEVIGGILELDPSQLKVVIAELRASPEMNDELRTGIVGFAMTVMADADPAGALALFVASGDMLGKNGAATQIVATALTKLAGEDPMAAMDWIRENSQDHADVLTSQTRAVVLAGAARQDPKLAFSLIGELGLSLDRMATAQISRAVKTPEEQTAMLAALRDYVAGTDDDAVKSAARFGALAGLSEQSVARGFDGSAQWLESAHLNEEEARVFVERIDPNQTKDDSGKWIDWMSSRFPAEDYTEKTRQIMDRWSMQDYQAAAAWLGGKEDGPAKSAAVGAFAKNVAYFEPATAAQWALTLPAGEGRAELLKSVYVEWSKKDESAAAAFAKENGITGEKAGE
ncbi:MAG: hypothetical protein JWO82_1865 [Akkermansiaceae bacterium]|nr:hypothetical protein [Akkermansiaceae bacterium]